MSNNQIVIEPLKAKLEHLQGKKKQLIQQYDEYIEQIEDALDVLAGKAVWRTQSTEAYDDLNPDYVRQSEEEI